MIIVKIDARRFIRKKYDLIQIKMESEHEFRLDFFYKTDYINSIFISRLHGYYYSCNSQYDILV